MNTSNLKLKDNLIVEPSGKRIRASDLIEGKCYLYKNLYKYRWIVKIEGNSVYYHDKTRLGMCSKQHFVAMCPHEATSEEVMFINETWDS